MFLFPLLQLHLDERMHMRDAEELHTHNTQAATVIHVVNSIWEKEEK